MRQIDFNHSAGRSAWNQISRRQAADPARVRNDALTRRVFGRAVSARQAVEIILERVRRQGDRALVHYLSRLEGVRTTVEGLRVSDRERRAASARVPAVLAKALQDCAVRIRAYHQAQLPKSAAAQQRPGVRVAERRRPLDRVGIYVPGGQAPLASTVLMNALPAKLAGVKEIIMATPPGAEGRVPDALLFAADLAGVTEVYRLGGAVAVAAFGLGTPSIRRVDKIVGPGNLFVTEAKRQIIGRVGIDSLAGPSEILIVADESANPERLAWDLLAQGEHGSGAVAVLLTPSAVLKAQVAGAAQAIVRQRPDLKPALSAITLVKVLNLEQAAILAEAYAPEHLSLQVKNADFWLERIHHFGAVFLGDETPQAMGDYTAGPNHVLPTGGTARWSSPLSVRDFMRYSSVIRYRPAGVELEGAAAIAVAESEGLQAHAESIRVRMSNKRRRMSLEP